MNDKAEYSVLHYHDYKLRPYSFTGRISSSSGSGRYHFIIPLVLIYDCHWFLANTTFVLGEFHPCYIQTTQIFFSGCFCIKIIFFWFLIPRSLSDDCKRHTLFSLELEATDASTASETVSDTTCCHNLDENNHSFYRRNNLQWCFFSLKFRKKNLYLCRHDYDLF
jgi:hypothetical protein